VGFAPTASIVALRASASASSFPPAFSASPASLTSWSRTSCVSLLKSMPFCCSATSTSWLSAFASAGFFAGSIEYDASLSFAPP
jgi:hypothetical protein